MGKDLLNVSIMESQPSGVDFSCSEDEYGIDERPVKDISFKLFYTHHRITALLVLMLLLVITMGYINRVETFEDKIWNSFLCSSVFVIFFSMMVFPNGPFIRPHPILWKIILGLGLVYCIILIFILFLDFEQVRSILFYIDPSLRINGPDMKNYAEDCTFKWSVVKEQIDAFCLMHFLGWMMKALLLRSNVLSWFFSVMWEISEVFFQVILPNFQECWWDVVILDILLCNWSGIILGTYILKYFELKNFHWESIKVIKGTRGKLKRLILQFSPSSLDPSNWFSTDCVFKRILQLSVFSLFWNMSELNTFFLKHVFLINTKHWTVFCRTVFIIAIAFPTVRQYYEYITNPRIKTLGIYSWIFVALSVLELAVVCKHGESAMGNFTTELMFGWLFVQVFLCTICVGFAIYCHNKKIKLRKKSE